MDAEAPPEGHVRAELVMSDEEGIELRIPIAAIAICSDFACSFAHVKLLQPRPEVGPIWLIEGVGQLGKASQLALANGRVSLHIPAPEQRSVYRPGDGYNMTPEEEQEWVERMRAHAERGRPGE